MNISHADTVYTYFEMAHLSFNVSGNNRTTIQNQTKTSTISDLPNTKADWNTNKFKSL